MNTHLHHATLETLGRLLLREILFEVDLQLRVPVLEHLFQFILTSFRAMSSSEYLFPALDLRSIMDGTLPMRRPKRNPPTTMATTQKALRAQTGVAGFSVWGLGRV